MKVHYLEHDNTMTIFAVVSKKRTNFDNKNIVCVRSYDMENGVRNDYQDIKENGINGIVDINTARKIWNRCIRNHKIKISESIYKKTNGREPMMDSEVCDMMTEIATKSLTGLQLQKLTKKIK
ncbi:TPA: hypothetical protein HA278_03870 [Candidatus Woesearchaeota archaeon]|nr:hypothetical protein [Candidatus Woesearchaeota archaeon]|tara:strand:+ start:265 stop:633 length:369 start_codon:yes stop_codon:yes gene_type:complete